MEDMYYRMDLSHDEYKELLRIVEKAMKFNTVIDEQGLFNKLDKPKMIKAKTGKTKSAKAATEARSSRAKIKFQNAWNLYQMEGKKITAYSISQEAGISFVTAQKYIKEMEEKNA